MPKFIVSWERIHKANPILNSKQTMTYSRHEHFSMFSIDLFMKAKLTS